MNSPEDDEGIKLVYVSKVYRCIQCKRCYISLAMYNKHLLEYHSVSTTTPTSSPQLTNSSLTDLVSNGTSHEQENTAKDIRTFNSKEQPSVKKNQEKISCNQWKICSSHSQAQPHSLGFDTTANSLTIKTEHEHELSPILDRNSNTQEDVNTSKTVQGDLDDDIELITLFDSDEERDSVNLSSNSSKSTIVIENSIETQDFIDNPVAIMANTQTINEEEIMLNSSQSLEASPPKASPKKPAPLPKMFMCLHCNRPFTKERTLYSHVKAVHTKYDGFKGEAVHTSPIKSKQDAIISPSGKAEKCSLRVRDRKRKLIERESNEFLSSTDNVGYINQKLRKTVRRIYGGLSKFLCIKCSVRFEDIDLLKQHAYNEHIKYTGLK